MLIVYRWLTILLTPFLKLYMWRRCSQGKEETTRLRERFGQPSLARPKGPLIHIHGDSVGETLSILPLLKDLLTDPTIHILITTWTITGAKMIGPQLPPRCYHQYLPVDNHLWIKKFFDHWQPQSMILIESSIWPNLLYEAKQRRIRVILLSACLSPLTQQRWLRFPRIAHKLFRHFDLISAQTTAIVNFIKQIGHPNVHVGGSLKYAATPLTYNQSHYDHLRQDIGERPFWIAASTHEPEEKLIARVHYLVSQDFPDLLTIIVPRHAERGPGILKDLQSNSEAIYLRTQNSNIPKDCAIYIADTLGELGLFYALSPIAFIGGSFAPLGGHNPIEAALLKCAIIWGPIIYNFQEVCASLETSAVGVKNISALTAHLKDLLENPQKAVLLAETAYTIVKEQQEILRHYLASLRPYILGGQPPQVSLSCSTKS